MGDTEIASPPGRRFPKASCAVRVKEPTVPAELRVRASPEALDTDGEVPPGATERSHGTGDSVTV